MANAHAKTIGDLQAAIEAALARLPSTPLPPGLEALDIFLSPPGMSARVSLRHAEKQRQIRRSADASHWNPQTCYVVIDFEADNPTEESDHRVASAERSTKTSDPLDQLVKILDSAEREPRFREFVGIKSFRDQYLVAHGGTWVVDAQARHAELAGAIDRGLVLRNSVPNPKHPSYPTTAIRVNREHPEARRILQAAAAERSAFKPIAIRGDALAATVLAERR